MRSALFFAQPPRLAPPPSPTTSHCNSLHPPLAIYTPELTLFRKKEEEGSGFRWRWTGQGREWRGKGNPKRKVFPHLPLPLALPPSPTNQPPPRFLKITQTSLPRSGRDRERGTAPHKKARRARRALAGQWGEHYTHGPPNATGNSLPYTRTQPTQATGTQQHHIKR